MKSKNKKVRYQNDVSKKEVRLPSNIGIEKFKWGLRSDLIDWEDTKFGFNVSKIPSFIKKIKPRFDGFCTMSWAELNKRKSCHPMGCEKISTDLRERLLTICPHDTPESLYQVDIASKHRIWGQKIEDVFYIMFNDEDHLGYVVNKKHT